MAELPIIAAENLGKQYIIRHETDGGSPAYATLRDSLAARFGALLRGVTTRRADKPALPAREQFWAVRGIDFAMERGEVLGVIGRNGAGKSTLLKLLSRITDPSEGRITLRGRVASLLEVGTGFHPELTGRENIYLNGAVLGMSRLEIRSKFDEIVDFSGVEHFLDTPIKRYSSGMSVRLAFAVAAHLDPEILIVDEVLAVGDIEFQRKCLGKMQSVAGGEGRTVLFVSHNMAAVRQLCSTGLLLDHGRALELGPCEDVVESYLRMVGSEGLTSAQSERSAHGVALVKVAWYGGSDAHPISERDSVETTSCLVFNDAYTLEVTLDAERELTGVALVLHIVDETGMQVCSVCSPEEGVDPFTLMGRRRFRMRIDSMSLLPGRYTLGVYIYPVMGHKPYLAIDRAMTFEVEAAMLGDARRPYRRDHGVFRLAGNLSMEDAEATDRAHRTGRGTAA